MTRNEMIAYIKANPNVKITHTLFDYDEYIYSDSNEDVWDENGNLFEDWYSTDGGRRDGIRDRVGGPWKTGWSLYKNKTP